MAPYFEKKLIELLPPLYKERDETGDLEAFLRIPATALDELKEHIDRFPELFDVDRCDPRFLSLLGEVVGHRFDPQADAEIQRREIREAIEIYRRKGTLPAIGRALAEDAWSGRIEETFRQALRLNRRGVLSRSKLPGSIYSLGAYRVEGDTLNPGLRDRLRFHHPAGTRVFFRQWLSLVGSMASDVEAVTKERVRRIGLGQLDETFVVGNNALNGSRRLTRTEKTGGLWWVTAGTTLLHEVERAGVSIRRRHGRKPRFRLNASPLNGEQLPNVWISERKLAICCVIETRDRPAPAAPFIRLAGQDLNRARLNRSAPACRFGFRQKDDYAEARAGFAAAANLFTLTQWPAPA